MSPDEVAVAALAFVLGPASWALWLNRMAPPSAGGHARGVIGLTLLGNAAVTLGILRRAGAPDVARAPDYLLLYVCLGVAWCRGAAIAFPLVGLSPRDDVIERHNDAALVAFVGAVTAVTLCYGGGNIGNGPGYPVVVFSSAVATLLLFAVWSLLAHFSAVVDAVTIDRDRAAGVRLGSFLIASGAIAGRAVAGDWVSIESTLRDARSAVPALAVLLLVALVMERIGRTSAARPRAPMLILGLYPGAAYLAIAMGTVAVMGWPR